MEKCNKGTRLGERFQCVRYTEQGIKDTKSFLCGKSHKEKFRNEKWASHSDDTDELEDKRETHGSGI